MIQEPSPAIRAIRLTELIQLTGVSRPTIWRWTKTDPTFPKPFQLSPAITCWDAQEVTDWIETKKAARGAQ
jgi:predicted DNA-binding transcriptional regulator AlpA